MIQAVDGPNAPGRAVDGQMLSIKPEHRGSKRPRNSQVRIASLARRNGDQFDAEVAKDRYQHRCYPLAPPDVPLRAENAIHTATALETGETEIWNNDRHLLAAVDHFGLAGRSA